LICRYASCTGTSKDLYKGNRNKALAETTERKAYSRGEKFTAGRKRLEVGGKRTKSIMCFSNDERESKEPEQAAKPSKGGISREHEWAERRGSLGGKPRQWLSTSRNQRGRLGPANKANQDVVHDGRLRKIRNDEERKKPPNRKKRS